MDPFVSLNNENDEPCVVQVLWICNAPVFGSTFVVLSTVTKMLTDFKIKILKKLEHSLIPVAY